MVFDRECRIFEVCNPYQAKRVLEKDLSISTALPCRISAFEEGGRIRLATLRPTVLLSMFNAPDLEPVAKEVEETLIQIMKKAAD